MNCSGVAADNATSENQFPNTRQSVINVDAATLRGRIVSENAISDTHDTVFDADAAVGGAFDYASIEVRRQRRHRIEKDSLPADGCVRCGKQDRLSQGAVGLEIAGNLEFVVAL